MLPDRILHLIALFARLPGVGEKTAQRFVLYLVEDGRVSGELGAALATLADTVRPCARCGNLAELDEDGQAVCRICRDHRRDSSLLCVVARVQDLMAIERSGAMRGRYFVLGKLLSPLDGVGPEELPLEALLARVKSDEVREVIIATPPSVDGEATAMLLARELGSAGLSVSRIASGVPHGGDLEFADQITLGRAIDGRRAL
ncbi:MAG: recombination mediator RecR [Sorangiineae bacterium]|nr:recombination mediator RecR [Polyangiaceae bacterium]MEB2321904.1 recombination mediator RecR [Sorangiineae bacterium]